jgi:hypothetical protein
MKDFNHKKYIEKFLQAEKKNDLMGIKLFGNPFWPYYRMYFHYKYLKHVGHIDNRGVNFRKNKFYYFKKFLILLINSKIQNLLSLKQSDYIIISSQRYREGKEIYVDHIKKNISDDNYIEFSFSKGFEFFKGPIYMDLIKILSKLFSKLGSTFVDVKELESVYSFYHDMGIDEHSFKTDVKRAYLEYKVWYYIYDFILERVKPKKIIYVGGIYFAPMVAVADNLNIETYELQHGVINRNHLAYHFPDYERKGYFAKNLLFMSKFWTKSADFPKGLNKIVTGNSYFQKKQEGEKKVNSIIIISQPTIGKELIKLIDSNKDFLLNYYVEYKLHPDEISNWEDNYPLLKKLQEKKVLKVITDTPELKTILNYSEFLIGVNSTVIYEGLDLNCKVIVVDYGFKYFTDLVEKAIVQEIDPSIPFKKEYFENFNYTKNNNIFFNMTNDEVLKASLEL